MGKLFIISTPIGNLEDITLRAVRILGECNTILAEDTRSTLNLLKYYKIAPTKQIISFFEGNEEQKLNYALSILLSGEDVALVSESGTPLISDPGFKLVRRAVENGIKVESIPGPTALVCALTSSGLPSNSFIFLGFLPKKEGKIKKILEQTKLSLETLDATKTAIFYESPHRLKKTLVYLLDVFGDISVVIARELTKVHEDIQSKPISEHLKYYHDKQPKGEITVLFSLQ